MDIGQLIAELILSAYVWLIPGIIGGLVLAIAFRSGTNRASLRRFFILASGWALATVIGGFSGTLLMHILRREARSIPESVLLITGFATTGAVIGALGAAISLSQLRVDESPQRTGAAQQLAGADPASRVSVSARY
jgi:ABC-type transport system involved in multi-copper enzyme maturation permease subunit